MNNNMLLAERPKTYMKGPDVMSKSARTQRRHRNANRGQTTLGAFGFAATHRRQTEVSALIATESLSPPPTNVIVRQESVEVEIPPPGPPETSGSNAVPIRQESVEAVIPPERPHPQDREIDEVACEAWEDEVDECIRGGVEIRSWLELREQIKQDLKDGVKNSLSATHINELYILRSFATLRVKGFGRIGASFEIARQWHEGEGVHFARKVRALARHYQIFEQLPEEKRGGDRSHCLLLDERVRKAARAWLVAQPAGSITSRLFQHTLNTAILPDLSITLKRPLCERTARRWLLKLGWRLTRLRKGVYMDGHEREDVVKYRQEVFLPAMAVFEERMTKFEGAELTRVAPTLKDGEKEIIPLFHDESCLSVNDYKATAW